MGPIIRNVIRDVIRPVMGDQALVSRFSPAARDYFARLDAAGLRVTTYDAANARLIDRLVANGGNFWPDSGAFCAMAGYLFPTGGTLIPLKDGHDAGTLNAFVSGDWNAVTGLVGRPASSTYVDSNRANNADGQNDVCIGALPTAAATTRGGLVASIDTAISFDPPGGFYRVLNRSGQGTREVDSAAYGKYAANSRTTSASYRVYLNETFSTETLASSTPGAGNYDIFRRGSLYSDARNAFYHIGPGLTDSEITEMELILTDWQTDLANA